MFLLDSDVARKICQYNLLDELLMGLNCAIADIAILPQLKFQLHLKNNAKAIEKLGSQAAVDQVELLVQQATEINISVATANRGIILSGPDIDTGEATLFAALCNSDDDSLVTGDKRFLVALSKIHNEQITVVWHRIISFEEAIQSIVHFCDFPSISAKIRNRPDVDLAVSIAFGRTTANDKPTVIEALNSYLNDLRKNTSEKYMFNAH